MMQAFRLLARLKFLRGTTLDPFGYTAERKAERALIADYEQMILGRIATLKAVQLPLLIKLAELPEIIRGYGHIKEQAMAKAATERARLQAALDDNSFAIAAE